MPSYTFKEGTCTECGREYKGLICDNEPHRNTCSNCRDGTCAVENARSLRYFHAQPHYDTGLGVQVASRRERSRIIKERGLVEVGGYNPDYLFDDIPLGKPNGEPEGLTDDFMEIWNEETQKPSVGEEI